MNKDLYPDGLNQHRSLKFQKLRNLISKNQNNITIEGLYGSSLSFLLIDLFSFLNKQIFYISNSKEISSYVYSDINEIIGEKNCSFLPSNFRNYENKIKDESNILNRSKTIDDIIGNKPKIIISHTEAIFEKIPKSSLIVEKTLTINVGQQLEINVINDKLFELNFEKDDYVQQPGDFSVRGNILDVFSFEYTNPIRFEFDDNVIESIREFNIDSQYSIKKINSANIKPDISNQNLIARDDSIISIIGKIGRASCRERV